MPVTLHDLVKGVVDSDPATCPPPWPPLHSVTAEDRRDRFLSLLTIYDLFLEPVHKLGSRARWAGHPAIAAVKSRLELDWLAELNAATPAGTHGQSPVAAIRDLAARDRLPLVYKWIAEHASLDELRQFLSIEGGPDGGFDDLVALCQVGLSGAAKLELARNYWDEMGNGRLEKVHTDLHRLMARSVQLPQLGRTTLPEAGLERSALGGLLATNRWLQPEMIGALGLTELQAGPRCRLVLKAFARLDLPAEARTFYEVHADVDPQHGRDWLEQVVGPLGMEIPEWRDRMVRGAAWRWHVNAQLFDTLDVRAALTAAA
jgi:hypothetical protein